MRADQKQQNHFCKMISMDFDPKSLQTVDSHFIRAFASFNCSIQFTNTFLRFVKIKSRNCPSHDPPFSWLHAATTSFVGLKSIRGSFICSSDSLQVQQ